MCLPAAFGTFTNRRMLHGAILLDAPTPDDLLSPITARDLPLAAMHQDIPVQTIVRQSSGGPRPLPPPAFRDEGSECGPAGLRAALDKVATGSYLLVMQDIVVVNVKRLKDQLSAYLREVKAGKTVLTTERGIVIAELRAPTVALRQDPESASTWAQWVREGKLIPPQAEKRALPRIGVKLPVGTAQALLDQERGE